MHTEIYRCGVHTEDHGVPVLTPLLTIFDVRSIKQCYRCQHTLRRSDRHTRDISPELIDPPVWFWGLNWFSSRSPRGWSPTFTIHMHHPLLHCLHSNVQTSVPVCRLGNRRIIDGIQTFKMAPILHACHILIWFIWQCNVIWLWLVFWKRLFQRVRKRITRATPRLHGKNQSQGGVESQLNEVCKPGLKEG